MMKRMTSAMLAAMMILCALCACGAEPAFSRGTTDGNTYTNNTFGVTYNKRGGWTFYTDEQLAEMKSLTVYAENYDGALTKAGKKGRIRTFPFPPGLQANTDCRPTTRTHRI